MQSPIFRLLSVLIMPALSIALIGVIWFVIQREPQLAGPEPARQTAPAAQQIDGIQAATPATAVPLSTDFVDAPPLTQATTISALPPTNATLGASVTARAQSIPPSATPTPVTERAAIPTTTFAILQPTTTPTPLTAMRRAVDLSQRPTPGWSVYSNGNEVNDLTVLNNTIWAATSGGVVAWNRSNNSAVKYTLLDGLTTNRTTAVVNCPLPGFGLIFGTAQGLQLYDTRREQWSVLNSSNSDMHYDDIATLHCSVDDGYLVVGYREHGLDIFDTENGEWQLVDRRNGLQHNTVEAVTVVGDLEALWVSSGMGISVLTQDSVLFYDDLTTPLETNAINVMVSDGDGTVWLGAQGKVYAINGETWTIYSPSYVLASQFPTGAITALAFGTDNTLWIGSDRGELCRLDLEVITCDPFFRADELEIAGAITALTVDNLGRLYVATARDGVRLYDDSSRNNRTAANSPPPWRSFALPIDIEGNQIFALTQDRAGYLWLLTDAGLQQWDPTQDMGRSSVLHFTDDNSRYPISTIDTLVADPQKGIWVAGENGGYFDGIDWTTFATTDGLVDRHVRAVAVDTEQRTWFGTDEGLSIWNGDSFFNLTRADGLPSNQMRAFLVDGDIVWIGTTDGLLRFAENRLQVFTTATTSLPSNFITALARDEEGAILIGTDQGLSRYVGATISSIAEFDGQVVRALAVLPGNAIWVATTTGLHYFNGLRWVSPSALTFPRTLVADLLFADRQGTVWIGTTGGLLRYTP